MAKFTLPKFSNPKIPTPKFPTQKLPSVPRFKINMNIKPPKTDFNKAGGYTSFGSQIITTFKKIFK